jgi:hypothetical protein
MFCPQCSNEIASERVRFCTHCRFPVGSMKEFIVTEVTKSQAEDEKKHYPLRQRDITLGAGLMLIGVIKAAIVAMATSGLTAEQIAVFFFTLGAMFSAFLLFSQLSPRQRGLSLGATLIFLASLIAAPLGVETEGAGILLVAAITLPVTLLLMRIVRLFMRIFFDKEVKSEKNVYVPPQPAFNAPGVASLALPPAQSVAAVDLNTQQTLKAEMAERFSVTEDSTELLKDKHSLNPQ